MDIYTSYVYFRGECFAFSSAFVLLVSDAFEAQI